MKFVFIFKNSVTNVYLYFYLTELFFYATVVDQIQLRSYFEKLRDHMDKLQQNESRNYHRQFSSAATSVNEVCFLSEQIRKQKLEYKNLKVISKL